MRSIRAVIGFALACLLAACGGGGSSADTPAPTPAASFSIGAAKEGVSVGGFTLAPGQSLPLTVKAGQQLRFDSNNAVTWAVASNNASANVVAANATTWTSTLSTPAAGGTVTLTATLVADTSKTASVVITVQPAFVLTAKVGGVAAASFSAQPGQAQTLDVQGGQLIELSSTDSVTWTTSQTGTGTPTAATTTTSWSGSFDSKTGATVGTITIRSSLDPSLSTTVTVNTAPQQFNRVARAVNDYITFNETDVRNDASSTSYSFTYRAASVNTDGSFLQTETQGGVVTRVYSMDADGNRLTRTYTSNNNACTYSPKRDYANFPLYVGKTWSSSWGYACATGYHETAALTGTVEAYETITVPAGNFDALRIHLMTSLTQSNDGNLTNGGASNAAYQEDVTCWWATSVGRIVKCTSDYTYTGTAPPTYLKSFVEEAAAIGNQSGNALNGAYKVMSAVGSTLTVSVDLDAKTLAYATGGTTVSGTLAASNGEWILSTPGNAITSTRLVLKDGFISGALPDRDAAGTWVAAPASGAREDLIVKDVAQWAGSYYNVLFSPCLANVVTCSDDAIFPRVLALTAAPGSSTQATAVNCNAIAATTGLLKAWLVADPLNGGCLTGSGNTNTRTWTADSEGLISSSSVSSPSTFRAIFAKVNGKITGFSANRSMSGSTTVGYSFGLLLPVVANTNASYIGAGPVGLMNRTLKTYVQGNYSSATGASASLSFETGTGTFTVQVGGIATGVATVNGDTEMGLFSDGRFGAWFSDSTATGGKSSAIAMFK